MVRISVEKEEILKTLMIYGSDGRLYDVVTLSFWSDEEDEDWGWYQTNLHPQGQHHVTFAIGQDREW